MRKLSIDEAVVREMYLEKRMTGVQIRKALGVSQSPLYRFLRNLKITRGHSEARKGYTYQPVEKRFWKKVLKTPTCWLWIGHKNKRGYGKIFLNGKRIFSHRASYYIHHGSIPKKLCVCHSCDNPGCVNPKHLFLGTQRENVHDMLSKKRDNHARGQRVNTSKLNEMQVREIRSLYSKGHGLSELGRKYGVAHSAIDAIVNFKSWAHLK